MILGTRMRWLDKEIFICGFLQAALKKGIGARKEVVAAFGNGEAEWQKLRQTISSDPGVALTS